ncbi:hypothetical protein [Peredibacter starrii]|uniref:Uncharacterized protein n=1 Tax=Peredibacter starrii TaxID=28202 RepID=A0AAX4HSP2_9BACT|nr:hypothetical protein [Peredibacter starrii]WPU66123.1 hypothetical protein SOO65_05130 [Peredibacter starrii]
MKLMLTLTLLLSSFTVFAKDQMLSDIIQEKRCHLEVAQDVIIQASQPSVTVGNALLVMKQKDTANNRRLKAGRVLKISSNDENYIFFNDAHVESICVYEPHFCHELGRIKASDFERWSQNKLKLVCNGKPTIDI